MKCPMCNSDQMSLTQKKIVISYKTIVRNRTYHFHSKPSQILGLDEWIECVGCGEKYVYTRDKDGSLTINLEIPYIQLEGVY